MQPEARISKKIIAAIREEFGSRVMVWKQHQDEFTPPGLPDIIGCLDGYFFGIETKRPGTRHNVSPRQSHMHSLIRGAYGWVEVCCSPAEALEFLDQMLDHVGPEAPRLK